jgi:hypothetical protein
LLCGVLPDLLTDFFPPSEIMTKVIGEFLSMQQPHPRLLAAVVFQVIVVAVGYIHYSPQPEICKYFYVKLLYKIFLGNSLDLSHT